MMESLIPTYNPKTWFGQGPPEWPWPGKKKDKSHSQLALKSFSEQCTLGGSEVANSDAATHRSRHHRTSGTKKTVVWLFITAVSFGMLLGFNADLNDGMCALWKRAFWAMAAGGRGEGKQLKS